MHSEKQAKFESIQLTKKQEKYLLRMCNTLFPEKGKFFEVLCGDIYYSKNGKFPGFLINWFEFCMTILMREICILRTNKDLGFDPWAFDRFHEKSIWKCLMFDEPKHPADYLYKEFKKLKL